MGIRMQYEGKDITQYVVITKCIHRDVSRGRCDMLEMELDHAATWYKWDPKKDDKIIITCDGYTTGTLYLNTVLPERNHYRLLATSMPSGSRQKKFDAWEKKTLSVIGAKCAAECGLGFSLFGISGGLDYPYLIRENETSAAFAARIAAMEGAVLKIVNGAYKLIGIEYAQGLAKCATLHIDTTQQNAVHTHTGHEKYGGITVISPFAQAKAADSAVKGGYIQTLTNLPAKTAGQAGRWARGLLMTQNRAADCLTITDAEFNPALTAMCHVAVDGNTDANGDWLVDEVWHDLYNRRDTVKMLKFVTTIG
jgi:hypothetical protein